VCVCVCVCVIANSGAGGRGRGAPWYLRRNGLVQVVQGLERNLHRPLVPASVWVAVRASRQCQTPTTITRKKAMSNSHVCDGERNMNHAHAPRRGAQCCTTSLAVPTGLWVRFGTVSPSGFACMAVHTTLEQQHTHAALHKEHGSICLWMCPHRPSHFSTSW
jgi:hypothetical protein